MADLPRRLGGGEPLVQHPLMGLEVQAGVGDLAAIGDLDAAEAVLCRELDAAPQVAVRGDHPAAHILGIAEAAERLRLELGRADLTSEIEALLMLGEAALDVAAREMQIAAQEVDAGALLGQAVLVRPRPAPGPDRRRRRRDRR